MFGSYAYKTINISKYNNNASFSEKRWGTFISFLELLTFKHDNLLLLSTSKVDLMLGCW